MIPVSSFLIDQECTLTLQTWGTDADGGAAVVSSIVRIAVPCVYLPGKGRREITTEPATGLRRVTQWVPVSFGFPEDVGLNIDDLITWIDDSDNTHTYQVKSYGPYVAGQGGWNVATVEEIT
jgi:hypothetical protein